MDRGIRKAIVAKKTICITYQSFKAREASTFCFSGYLLKEYRNRWFVLGMPHKRQRPVVKPGAGQDSIHRRTCR
jgi:hypothetical protein